MIISQPFVQQSFLYGERRTLNITGKEYTNSVHELTNYSVLKSGSIIRRPALSSLYFLEFDFTIDQILTLGPYYLVRSGGAVRYFYVNKPYGLRFNDRAIVTHYAGNSDPDVIELDYNEEYSGTEKEIDSLHEASGKIWAFSEGELPFVIELGDGDTIITRPYYASVNSSNDYRDYVRAFPISQEPEKIENLFYEKSGSEFNEIGANLQLVIDAKADLDKSVYVNAWLATDDNTTDLFIDRNKMALKDYIGRPLYFSVLPTETPIIRESIASVDSSNNPITLNDWDSQQFYTDEGGVLGNLNTRASIHNFILNKGGIVTGTTRTESKTTLVKELLYGRKYMIIPRSYVDDSSSLTSTSGKYAKMSEVYPSAEVASPAVTTLTLEGDHLRDLKQNTSSEIVEIHNGTLYASIAQARKETTEFLGTDITEDTRESSNQIIIDDLVYDSGKSRFDIGDDKITNSLSYVFDSTSDKFEVTFESEDTEDFEVDCDKITFIAKSDFDTALKDSNLNQDYADPVPILDDLRNNSSSATIQTLNSNFSADSVKPHFPFKKIYTSKANITFTLEMEFTDKKYFSEVFPKVSSVTGANVKAVINSKEGTFVSSGKISVKNGKITIPLKMTGDNLSYEVDYLGSYAGTARIRSAFEGTALDAFERVSLSVASANAVRSMREKYNKPNSQVNLAYSVLESFQYRLAGLNIQDAFNNFVAGDDSYVTANNNIFYYNSGDEGRVRDNFYNNLAMMQFLLGSYLSRFITGFEEANSALRTYYRTTMATEPFVSGETIFPFSSTLTSEVTKLRIGDVSEANKTIELRASIVGAVFKEEEVEAQEEITLPVPWFGNVYRLGWSSDIYTSEDFPYERNSAVGLQFEYSDDIGRLNSYYPFVPGDSQINPRRDKLDAIKGVVIRPVRPENNEDENRDNAELVLLTDLVGINASIGQIRRVELTGVASNTSDNVTITLTDHEIKANLSGFIEIVFPLQDTNTKDLLNGLYANVLHYNQEDDTGIEYRQSLVKRGTFTRFALKFYRSVDATDLIEPKVIDTDPNEITDAWGYNSQLNGSYLTNQGTAVEFFERQTGRNNNARDVTAFGWHKVIEQNNEGEDIAKYVWFMHIKEDENDIEAKDSITLNLTKTPVPAPPAPPDPVPVPPPTDPVVPAPPAPEPVTPAPTPEPEPEPTPAPTQPTPTPAPPTQPTPTPEPPTKPTPTNPAPTPTVSGNLPDEYGYMALLFESRAGSITNYWGLGDPEIERTPEFQDVTIALNGVFRFNSERADDDFIRTDTIWFKQDWMTNWTGSTPPPNYIRMRFKVDNGTINASVKPDKNGYYDIALRRTGSISRYLFNHRAYSYKFVGIGDITISAQRGKNGANSTRIEYNIDIANGSETYRGFQDVKNTSKWLYGKNVQVQPRPPVVIPPSPPAVAQYYGRADRILRVGRVNNFIGFTGSGVSNSSELNEVVCFLKRNTTSPTKYYFDDIYIKKSHIDNVLNITTQKLLRVVVNVNGTDFDDQLKFDRTQVLKGQEFYVFRFILKGFQFTSSSTYRINFDTANATALRYRGYRWQITETPNWRYKATTASTAPTKYRLITPSGTKLDGEMTITYQNNNNYLNAGGNWLTYRDHGTPIAFFDGIIYTNRIVDPSEGTRGVNEILFHPAWLRGRLGVTNVPRYLRMVFQETSGTSYDVTLVWNRIAGIMELYNVYRNGNPFTIPMNDAQRTAKINIDGANGFKSFNNETLGTPNWLLRSDKSVSAVSSGGAGAIGFAEGLTDETETITLTKQSGNLHNAIEYQSASLTEAPDKYDKIVIDKLILEASPETLYNFVPAITAKRVSKVFAKCDIYEIGFPSPATQKSGSTVLGRFIGGNNYDLKENTVEEFYSSTPLNFTSITDVRGGIVLSSTDSLIRINNNGRANNYIAQSIDSPDIIDLRAKVEYVPGFFGLSSLSTGVLYDYLDRSDSNETHLLTNPQQHSLKDYLSFTNVNTRVVSNFKKIVSKEPELAIQSIVSDVDGYKVYAFTTKGLYGANFSDGDTSAPFIESLQKSNFSPVIFIDKVNYLSDDNVFVSQTKSRERLGNREYYSGYFQRHLLENRTIIDYVYVPRTNLHMLLRDDGVIITALDYDTTIEGYSTWTFAEGFKPEKLFLINNEPHVLINRGVYQFTKGSNYDILRDGTKSPIEASFTTQLVTAGGLNPEEFLAKGTINHLRIDGENLDGVKFKILSSSGKQNVYSYTKVNDVTGRKFNLPCKIPKGKNAFGLDTRLKIINDVDSSNDVLLNGLVAHRTSI